ncbi:MAG TPA: hypothetical protein VGL56_19770 [Fimbriimonadaceae bacterium]
MYGFIVDEELLFPVFGFEVLKMLKAVSFTFLLIAGLLSVAGCDREVTTILVNPGPRHFKVGGTEIGGGPGFDLPAHGFGYGKSFDTAAIEVELTDKTTGEQESVDFLPMATPNCQVANDIYVFSLSQGVKRAGKNLVEGLKDE